MSVEDEDAGGKPRRRGSQGKTDTSIESRSFFRNYGLEICVLLSFMGSSNSSISVQNFYIDRICRIEKNYSLVECHNLTADFYEKDEKRVEVKASEYAIYQNFIENGPPILFCFFLGSWTDNNGSKPFVVISLFGYFLSAFMYTIHSFLPDLPPTYFLTCSIPMAICGGLTSLLLSSVSLLTRETSIMERSFRISVLFVCIDIGSTLGYFLGERVYILAGFPEVFMTSTALHGLSVIIAIFLVTEKIPENSLRQSGCSARCLEFFDVGSVKETVITCFKKRQNNRRCWIILAFVGVLLVYSSYLGRYYWFFYTRNKFGWDFADYSNYTIATSLMANIGGVLMTLIVIRFLKIPDIYVGFITVLSNLSGLLIRIFGQYGWCMYLGSAIQMCGAITTAVLRSILSKCVEPEEQGKLFSFVTCVEMTMPFIVGPLYGLIYMNTAETLPNAIFIVPIGLQSIVFLFYVYLYCTKGSFSPYSALREENNENERPQRA